MASEQGKLEFSLLETQSKLEYFKGRLQKDPNPLDHKWVDIYTERLKKIKERLVMSKFCRFCKKHTEHKETKV